MAVGAAYDLVLGAAVVTALEPLSRILPIPFPGEPFYARTQGVLLIGLGIFYAFAAHDLERSLRNVAGAIAARTMGGVYLIGYAWLEDVSWFFAVFGAADLLFAIWHWVLLRVEIKTGFWELLLFGERSS